MRSIIITIVFLLSACNHFKKAEDSPQIIESVAVKSIAQTSIGSKSNVRTLNGMDLANPVVLSINGVAAGKFIDDLTKKPIGKANASQVKMMLANITIVVSLNKDSGVYYISDGCEILETHSNRLFELTEVAASYFLDVNSYDYLNRFCLASKISECKASSLDICWDQQQQAEVKGHN